LPTQSFTNRATCTGTWKGLEVAIKTVIFEGGPGGSVAPPAAAASEAAIAASLEHRNFVATHAHHLRTLVGGGANELRVLKLYLIQARTRFRIPARTAASSAR
jgi:hypothetical protein